MGADFIKYWKVYRLITGEQYQRDDLGTLDVFNE